MMRSFGVFLLFAVLFSANAAATDTARYVEESSALTYILTNNAGPAPEDVGTCLAFPGSIKCSNGKKSIETWPDVPSFLDSAKSLAGVKQGSNSARVSALSHIATGAGEMGTSPDLLLYPKGKSGSVISALLSFQGIESYKLYPDLSIAKWQLEKAKSINYKPLIDESAAINEYGIAVCKRLDLIDELEAKILPNGISATWNFDKTACGNLEATAAFYQMIRLAKNSPMELKKAKDEARYAKIAAEEEAKALAKLRLDWKQGSAFSQLFVSEKNSVSEIFVCSMLPSNLEPKCIVERDRLFKANVLAYNTIYGTTQNQKKCVETALFESGLKADFFAYRYDMFYNQLLLNFVESFSPWHGDYDYYYRSGSEGKFWQQPLGFDNRVNDIIYYSSIKPAANRVLGYDTKAGHSRDRTLYAISASQAVTKLSKLTYDEKTIKSKAIKAFLDYFEPAVAAKLSKCYAG